MEAMKFLVAVVTCVALGFSSSLGGQNDLAEKSERGKALMAAGRFEEAVPVYRDLANALPGKPGPAMDLGMALHMAGHEQEAVTEFRKVLKLDPSDVPARLFLGAAYLGLNEPAKAVEPLKIVVRRQPKNADARLLLGDAFLYLERYQESAGQYERLTQLEATNPRAWNGLGLSYEGLAGRNFDQLEKVAPESAYWLDLVGESHAKGDELKGAFFFYREALKKDPDLRGVHVALADIYRKTDHQKWAAIEQRKEASLPPLHCRESVTMPRLTPKALECNFWAGRYQELVRASRAEKDPQVIYWRTRAYNELAKLAFSRLAELPPSEEVHQLLAKIQFSQRKYSQAAKEWKQALEFSLDSSYDQQGFASSLSAAGDYEHAEPLLEKLVKDFPDSAQLNYWLGYSLLGLERPADSIPYLEKAVQIDPTPLEPHRDLARAYLRVGEIAKALPHVQAASSIDTDGSLYYQLAQAYRKNGQKNLEMATLAKFHEIQNSSAAEKKRLQGEIQITAP